MANAIDLKKFFHLLDEATASRISALHVEYPSGPTFNHEQGPSEKFLASCQRGILVPVIIDQDGFLIDGVKRCVGAFAAGIGSVPCLVVEPLTPDERLAFRVLANPDREISAKTAAQLKSKVNFGRLPNMKYRTDILKAANEAVETRREISEILFKKKATRFDSTFAKRQVRIAESAIESVHQLDVLLSFYEEPPSSLVKCRKNLVRSIKTIVEFRQLNPKEKKPCSSGSKNSKRSGPSQPPSSP